MPIVKFNDQKKKNHSKNDHLNLLAIVTHYCARTTAFLSQYMLYINPPSLSLQQVLNLCMRVCTRTCLCVWCTINIILQGYILVHTSVMELAQCDDRGRYRSDVWLACCGPAIAAAHSMLGTNWQKYEQPRYTSGRSTTTTKKHNNDPIKLIRNIPNYVQSAWHQQNATGFWSE